MSTTWRNIRSPTRRAGWPFWKTDRQGNLWGNIPSIDSDPPRTESHQYKKVQTDNAVDLKRERAKAAGVTGIFTLSAQAKLSYPKWVATGQHYHTERQLEDILWPICDRSYLVAEVTLVKTRKQSNFADGDDRACYVHILTMWNLLICIYRRSMDNYYPATPEYISRVCIIRTPDKTKLAYD